MTVDAKIATLHEFDEWRQENGLFGTPFAEAVSAYEAHLRSAERADITDTMRRIIRGEVGLDLSPAERDEQLLRLLASIT